MRRVMIEMTYAIQDDRILVLDPHNAPGNTLVDSTCHDRSLQCVVEDITSCEGHVTPDNSVTELTRPTVPFQDVPAVAMVLIIKYLQSIGVQATGAYARYWWRSQMYAYLMRPRTSALARMFEMRINSTLQVGSATRRNATSQVYNSFLGVRIIDLEQYRQVPFPLPHSTMSIHIRHGDKASEGKLISTRDYIVAAERFLHRNPLYYLKQAFVSSEDPGVIEYIIKTPHINPSMSFSNTNWLW